MIDPDVVRSAGTSLQACARSFAHKVITPTIAAAPENKRAARDSRQGLKSCFGFGGIMVNYPLPALRLQFTTS